MPASDVPVAGKPMIDGAGGSMKTMVTVGGCGGGVSCGHAAGAGALVGAADSEGVGPRCA